MTESSVKAASHKEVKRVCAQYSCARPKIYNHQDRFTGGMPDSTITWNDRTSWLEYKLLEAGEDIHQELGLDQLTELCDLENACRRAWVIAYRKANRKQPLVLDIYRPTKLRILTAAEPRLVQPVATEVYEGIGAGNWSLLWDKGVIRLAGHNHAAVAALITQTHL